MKSFSLFLIAILFLNFPLFSKAVHEKTTVYFNTADYQLDENAKAQLDLLLKETELNPDFEIFIEGHTDNRGTVGFNETLSLDRSKSVKMYLLQKGINENQILIRHRGELAPKVPNTTDENLGNNRRVEVTITSYQFENIADLERELNPSANQTFHIDSQQENVIQGKKGITILIPKNAFRSANGEVVQGEVEVELTEALSFSDFIVSGLETKSGEQLLESGGMLKVAAKDMKGNEVLLNKNSKLVVSVPSENRKENMAVFLSKNGADWNSTNQKITNEVDFKAFRPYPKMPSREFKLPKFEYTVESPLPPKAPGKIQSPHQPRETSYKRAIPWYKLKKEKIRERQERNYQAALERYDKRMERYNRFQDAYEKKRKAYEKTYSEYERAVQCWEEDKKVARAQFRSTAEYQDALSKQRKIYDYDRSNFELDVRMWKAEREKAALSYGEKMDRLGKADQEGMDKYVFAINQLSWINVDRFYKIAPEEKQLVVMNTKDVKNEKVLILFKNINSMLSCNSDEVESVFRLENFPKKEEAFIFAYKVVNKRPMLYFMEMNGSDEYELKYEKSSFAEIKGILKQFQQG